MAITDEQAQAMRQEIFDAVWQHFVVQGQPYGYSVSGDRPSCCYRTDDGNRCAVGLAMLDSEYDPQMETTGLDRAVETNSVFAPFFARVGLQNLDFLCLLQAEHDEAAFSGFSPEKFGEYLRTWIESRPEHGIRLPEVVE